MYSVDILYLDQYLDQWNFYEAMFQESGALAAFLQQHGPHRLGLGGALTYLLAQATGFSAVAESYMILLFQFGSAVLGISLARRLAPDARWPAFAVLLIVLNPLHGETITSLQSLSASVLPLFLLLLIAHCWMSDSGWVKWGLLPILAGISLFTGYGLFVYVATGVLLLVDAGIALRTRAWASARRSAGGLGFLGLAAVPFVSGYQTGMASHPAMTFPHDPMYEYLEFVFWLMGSLFRPIGWPTPYVGALIFVATMACLVAALRSYRRDRAAQVICLLIVASLAYAFGTAIGRVDLGVQFGSTYRYFTMVSPTFLVLCYFLAARTDSHPWVARTSVAFVFAVALGFAINVSPMRAFFEYHRSGKEAWLAAYEETGSQVQANDRSGYPIHPNPDLIADRLQYLVDHRLSAFREP